MLYYISDLTEGMEKGDEKGDEKIKEIGPNGERKIKGPKERAGRDPTEKSLERARKSKAREEQREINKARKKIEKV